MTSPLKPGVHDELFANSMASTVALLGPMTSNMLRPDRTWPTTTRLPDGTTGYYEDPTRGDQCLQAAIATVLQVPLTEVPDFRIDEQLDAGVSTVMIRQRGMEELAHWLADRSLEMVAHRRVPVARRRWIGIVPIRGDFQDHCLVMSRGDLLFDPAPPAKLLVRRFQARHVRFGVSFKQGGR